MVHIPLVGKCRHGIYNCSDCDWSEWLKDQKKQGWKTDEEELYLYRRVSLLNDEDKPKFEQ